MEIVNNKSENSQKYKISKVDILSLVIGASILGFMVYRIAFGDNKVVEDAVSNNDTTISSAILPLNATGLSEFGFGDSLALVMSQLNEILKIIGDV